MGPFPPALCSGSDNGVYTDINTMDSTVAEPISHTTKIHELRDLMPYLPQKRKGKTYSLRFQHQQKEEGAMGANSCFVYHICWTTDRTF